MRKGLVLLMSPQGRNCAHLGGAQHWWALSWPHDITTTHHAQFGITGGHELRGVERPAVSALSQVPAPFSLPIWSQTPSEEHPLAASSLASRYQSLAFKRQSGFLESQVDPIIFMACLGWTLSTMAFSSESNNAFPSQQQTNKHLFGCL